MTDALAPGPDGHPAALTLDALRALLLTDADGDGFADSLTGPVWLATGSGPDDVDAAVSAAAELLAALAERALVLPVEARLWPSNEPGFVIGRAPPSQGSSSAARTLAEAHSVPTDGVMLRVSGGALTVRADDAAALYTGVTAWLDAQSVTRGAAADEITPAHQDDEAQPRAARRLSLGTLESGLPVDGEPTSQGGLYDGSVHRPERFVAGFAPTGGVPEALAVAVRLALGGVATPWRVIAPPQRAGVRTVVDDRIPAGTWQVRIVPRDDDDVIEIVGHDAPTLSSACRYFASEYPRLPDGTWLDDLEHRLTRLVRGETRDGRLAAVAVTLEQLRSAGHEPHRAELPNPPADAALRLAVPVRNSARDGELQRWALHVPWEGERLLLAADALLPSVRERAARVTVEAYASEGSPVRHRLANALQARFEAAGTGVDGVVVRHAYRPALHWLVDEVVPELPSQCSTVRIQVDRQPEADGAAERWLRELYPAAELVEVSRPDVRVELELGPERDRPRYSVTFLDDAGRQLGASDLEPIVVPSPLPEGGVTPGTSAGIRVWDGDEVIAEFPVASDADAFWTWFARTVLPEVTGLVDPSDAPAMHELAVVASLSEPDERLPVDHETDSVIEALHEEVYFGVLEAFQSVLEGRPGAGAPRSASPGRILPFFHAAEAGATQAHVLLRARGSNVTGAVMADGRRVPAPDCEASVRVLGIHGRGDAVTDLVVQMVPRTGSRAIRSNGASPPISAGDPAGDGRAVAALAARRLAWIGSVRPEFLPGQLTIRVDVDGSIDSAAIKGPITARDLVEPLPARPLVATQVVGHARALAARHRSVRVRVPRETALGQPLCVFDLGTPAGPATSHARRAAWKPSLLVSARQHGNEPTSTQAVFAWIEQLLGDSTVTARANVIVHPLENPDGARLHASLCAIAPNHMHHAARYTAFGADLQSAPRVRGEVIAESLMRRDVARYWRPVLHLNDHGYPAHAWVRSQTGHVPRGFEDWSLPTGHFTILTTHGDEEDDLAALREVLGAEVARALASDENLRAKTDAQVRRSARYRPAPQTPFTYRLGFPFWSNHLRHDAGAADESALTPLVTVITEVPDETVTGDDWEACARAHVAINDAVARTVLQWLDANQ